MGRVLALTAIALAFTITADAQTTALPRFELRGYSFGDTLKEPKGNGLWCNTGDEVPTEVFCVERSRPIAGIETALLRSYLDDKLYSMTLVFSSSGYDRLAEAFTLKYGDPASTAHNEIQNMAGTAFVNETKTWKFAEGEMTLSRYGTTVTDGQLVALNTERGVERERRRKVQAAQAARRDLGAPVKKN